VHQTGDQLLTPAATCLYLMALDQGI